jgi:hypothetical protein
MPRATGFVLPKPSAARPPIGSFLTRADFFDLKPHDILLV